MPETISPAVEESRPIRSSPVGDGSQQTGGGVRMVEREGDDKTDQCIRHPPEMESDEVDGKENRK